MIRSFSDYAAIVEFLVREQGLNLDDAVRMAQVPLHYIDQVKSYVAGPVEITPPDLLVQPQSLLLCTPLPENQPQPYSDALWTYLLNERRRDRSVVENLVSTSLDLTCRLPQPTAGEKFQTRGLVVGYIQSGKTANMAALIARAADQGYKMFIVLAGLMNDLRAQTQRRLDQEIAGTSDNPSQDSPFVQHLHWVPQWVRMTKSGVGGDFQPGTHNDLNPQTPKLAVLKKNVRRLEAFTAWLRKSPVPLSQLPAIVIDDEADQASIDTNYGRVDETGEELDPTKTNACIRDLLQALPKCVYIGYTATPFANVLIDVDVEKDLFPRDFIAALPEPVGYLGPRQLFGLGMTPSDLSAEGPERPPLDVIRYIAQDQLDKLDNLNPGEPCPEVLSTALLVFLISSCTRLARGHDRDHFTMLVHPSQRTDDHIAFASIISEEISFLRVVTARPRSFPDIVERARELWNNDFSPTSRSAGADIPLHDFDTIWKFSKAVADAIEVKTLNVRSEDELDYSGAPKRYIAVGGNKLSRGLTLEGLTVSLFTRSTNQYDTLLQMGRWFGFRPGYHDLTRMFVEEGMAIAFADLARVELELREDLRKYAQQPYPPTPAELAPKVRAHPSMEVTSRMKMGAGRFVRISFQSTTQNTVSFPTGDLGALRSNKDAGRAFIGSLGRPTISSSVEGMHIWNDIHSTQILDFISAYSFGRRTQLVSRAPLTSYIQRQNDKGELLLWDVVIPKGNSNLEPYHWTNEIFARHVLRSPMTSTSIKVLQSPRDIQEWRDRTGRLNNDPNRGGIFLYLIDKNSGMPDKTFFPPPAQPEDILGFVLVFPASNSGATIDYVSQHEQ